VGWGKNQSRTNIHEFLGIRKGELVANGGHHRFLTRVEICVGMLEWKDHDFLRSLSRPWVGWRKRPTGAKKPVGFTDPPLEGDMSAAEVELLPPKSEDIAVSRWQQQRRAGGEV
jgi:hypothetical protein